MDRLTNSVEQRQNCITDQAIQTDKRKLKTFRKSMPFLKISLDPLSFPSDINIFKF